jgi:pentatricopeptide repeat protein
MHRLAGNGPAVIHLPQDKSERNERRVGRERTRNEGRVGRERSRTRDRGEGTAGNWHARTDSPLRARRSSVAASSGRVPLALNSFICKELRRGKKQPVDVQRFTSSRLRIIADSSGYSLEEAWACLDAMRAVAVPLNDHIGAAMIKACGKHDRLGQIPKVLAALKEEGVPMGVMTYTALIRAHGLRKDNAGVQRWYRRMREYSTIKLDFAAYQVSVAALAEMDPAEALRLYDAARRIQQPGKGEELARHALIACRKSGNAAKALEILRDMESNLPGDLKPFHSKTAMEACIEGGRPGDALDIFDEIATARLTDEFAYGLALKACAECDDANRAVGLYLDMPTARIVPTEHTFRYLIAALGRGELSDYDINWVEEEMRIAKVTPTALFFNDVIRCLGRNGQVDRAIAMLDQMGPRHGRPEPTAETFAEVMVACLNAQRDDDVERVYARLGAAYMPGPFPAHVAMQASTRNGRYREALAVFDQVAVSERGKDLDARCWNAALIACEKLGDGNRAQSYFERMRAAGTEPDAVTYDNLIAAWHATPRNDSTAIDHTIGLLLQQAANEGLYAPGLGYEGAGLVDFHVQSLRADGKAEGGLSKALAETVFDYHHAQEMPMWRLHFSVGQHGEGIVKKAISERMKAIGLEPVEMPGNPGVLVDRQLAALHQRK